MSINVGIFPGSFNPFTIGHYDIYSQAKHLFDEVIVVRLINQSKSNTTQLFLEKNIENPDLYIENKNKLLTDVISEYKKVGGEHYRFTIIRGLRNGYDLEYELNLWKTVDQISKEIIPVVFFRCNPAISHVSSSMVREIASYDKELARQFIPKINVIDKY